MFETGRVPKLHLLSLGDRIHQMSHIQRSEMSQRGGPLLTTEVGPPSGYISVPTLGPFLGTYALKGGNVRNWPRSETAFAVLG